MLAEFNNLTTRKTSSVTARGVPPMSYCPSCSSGGGGGVTPLSGTMSSGGREGSPCPVPGPGEGPPVQSQVLGVPLSSPMSSGWPCSVPGLVGGGGPPVQSQAPGMGTSPPPVDRPTENINFILRSTLENDPGIIINLHISKMTKTGPRICLKVPHVDKSICNGSGDFHEQSAWYVCTDTHLSPMQGC